jgi:hypothetical protein
MEFYYLDFEDVYQHLKENLTRQQKQFVLLAYHFQSKAEQYLHDSSS